MAFPNINCSSSRDCTVVVGDKEVVRDCIIDEFETGSCFCNSFYGYVGDNCDIVSPQVRFWRGSSLLLLLLSFISMCCTLSVLYKLYRLKQSSHFDFKQIHRKLLEICVCLFLLFVALLIHSTQFLIVSLDSFYLEIIEQRFFLSSSLLVIEMRNSALTRLVSALVSLLNLAITLLIGGSWSDITKVIHNQSVDLKTNKFAKVFKFSTYALSLLTLCTVILAVFNYIQAAVIITNIAVLLVLVLFILGGSGVLKTLKTQIKSLKFVRFTRRIQVLLIGGVVFFFTLVGIIDEDQSTGGAVDPTTVILVVVQFFEYFLATFDLWYVNRLCYDLAKKLKQGKSDLEPLISGEFD